jgi:hypothetical protein
VSVIDWALYSERAVGRGSVTYTDVINRPLREVMTISGQDPDANFGGFSLVGHTHDAAAVVSGTLAPARGGTGLSSPTAGGLLVAAAAAAMTLLAPGASGQVVRSNGTGWAAAAIVAADISDLSSASTGITRVGTLVAGAIGAGFTAIPDSALATIGTAGKVANSATTATAANAINTIVARDGSGNFAAGVITASFTGALTGNAATATKLAASVNINGVAFDGSANVTVPAAAATLTGTTLAANVVASSLTGVGILTAGTWQATIIAPLFGGTGVANTNTITLGGNVNTAAAFATVGGGLTLTVTGATNVTLPTSGTLVNTAVTTLASLSLVNGQTISPAANFTGSVAVTTGLTVGGSADLQGGVKVSGGTFAGGHSFFVSATTGLNVVGHVTGGSPTADFTLVNNQGLGQTVMDVPTGTINVRIYGALTVASTAVFNGSLTSNAGFFGTTGSFNSGLTVTGGSSLQAVSAGLVTLSNAIQLPGNSAAAIQARNAANSAYVDLLFMNGSDAAVIPRALNVSTTLTVGTGLTVSAGTTAVQALTATTGAFSAALSATNLVTVNRASAASILGYFAVTRNGTPLYYVGQDAGDRGAILNAAAGAANMWWTDAGDFGIRGGLGITSDFTVNTSKFTVAAASGNTVIAGSATVAGTAVFNGVLTSNAGLFGTTASFNNTLAVAGTLTVTGGGFIAGGDLFVNAANGLFVVGKTGSSTDLVLANGLGGTVIDVPTGKTVARFAASAAANASARFPHGSAPTSPVDGDFWTTISGAFIRINGVTKTFTLT